VRADAFSTRLNVASNRLNDTTWKWWLGRSAGSSRSVAVGVTPLTRRRRANAVACDERHYLSEQHCGERPDTGVTDAFALGHPRDACVAPLRAALKDVRRRCMASGAATQPNGPAR
jgi:hypothetical protein